VAHRPYLDAVVAAIETAGIGVESYEVEGPSIDTARVASINIDQLSAGVFTNHQALISATRSNGPNRVGRRLDARATATTA
jgi:hypothetical protein